MKVIIVNVGIERRVSKISNYIAFIGLSNCHSVAHCFSICRWLGIAAAAAAMTTLLVVVVVVVTAAAAAASARRVRATKWHSANGNRQFKSDVHSIWDNNRNLTPPNRGDDLHTHMSTLLVLYLNNIGNSNNSTL